MSFNNNGSEIYKFDNEYLDMISNNSFEQYYLQSIINLWKIVYKNELILSINNINLHNGFTLIEIIKKLKQLSLEERINILDKDFTEKEWYLLLFITKNNNLCSCNVIYNSCRLNSCNKLHIISNHFWQNVINYFAKNISEPIYQIKNKKTITTCYAYDKLPPINLSPNKKLVKNTFNIKKY
jgi:hypothetical protein